jgi:hypothetical protein
MTARISMPFLSQCARNSGHEALASVWRTRSQELAQTGTTRQDAHVADATPSATVDPAERTEPIRNPEIRTKV